jgi:Helix-turn-helix domain
MTESQRQQILEYLKTGKTLTPLDALELFGCFRLSARIYELKDSGWPIHCDRRSTESGKVVGHYTMVQDKLWWPDQH